jgi:hypothetical protein
LKQQIESLDPLKIQLENKEKLISSQETSTQKENLSLEKRENQIKRRKENYPIKKKSTSKITNLFLQLKHLNHLNQKEKTSLNKNKILYLKKIY